MQLFLFDIMDFLERSILSIRPRKEIRLFALDEVGRGPLAGPVVSCCTLFQGSAEELKEVLVFSKNHGITDSKKLTTKRRQKILEELGIDLSSLEGRKRYRLYSGRIEFFLYENDQQIIDKINILQASLHSMGQAALKLNIKNEDHCWVDGNKIPKELHAYPHCRAIVKGDSKSALIAMASIIAKEWRDLFMKNIARIHPHYGFEKHSGYPTAFHKEAIKSHGICPYHRKSFKGVREYVEQGSAL